MKSRSTPTFALLVAALVVSLIATACSSDDGTNTVLDVAASNPEFSTLASALERTGLDVALAGDGPFTVLAPTNEAFARLPAGLIDQIDDETLSEILLYHVIAGDVRAASVAALTTAETLGGQSISIAADSSGVRLNSITQVTATDVVADNGVVHVIDSVMLPASMIFPGTLVDAALAYPAFDTLVGAVTDASLAGALAGDNEGAGLTLFAPDNQAFESLGIDLGTLSVEELSNVLLYHVVGDTVDAASVVTLSEAPTLQGSDIGIEVIDGGVVLNGDIGVVRTDLVASNGIAHIINGVLVPAQ